MKSVSFGLDERGRSAAFKAPPTEGSRNRTLGAAVLRKQDPIREVERNNSSVFICTLKMDHEYQICVQGHVSLCFHLCGDFVLLNSLQGSSAVNSHVSFTC